MQPLKNPKLSGLESFLVGELMKVVGRLQARRGHRRSLPLPILCSITLFQMVAPKLYPFNKWIIVSTFLSPVNYPNNLSNPRRMGVGTPDV